MRLSIRGAPGQDPAGGWTAFLRTTLGRAAVLRAEIVQAHSQGAPPAGAAMHDIPMHYDGQAWHVDMALAEPGFFRAKAYLRDARGWQHWPQGPDITLSVHPDHSRSGNTIYCAFPRLFGPTRDQADTKDAEREARLLSLEKEGYAVLPPSGKLRDLTRALPHIADTLGCRILHLLPVNPTPATYARFGRFGSPYAALDLAGIDPGLVEFDRRTTGVDQFRELTRAAHVRDMRVFLDIVINHTGWGSTFHENHPEWFLRTDSGHFKSPGAWGTVWEDLVELRHDNVPLWDEISTALLAWCQRGVDGFRCDAGYMVPVPAWQYIIARVQQVFPDVVFLLEGLGGAWESTQALLQDGGMQWAYSELFQNFSGEEVSGYLDHTLRQSGNVGTLVHYSETHDNPRLAARGRAWSLLRNRLCALASDQGAFGFTCGVEWLAPEKVNVHASRGLAWGSRENIVAELAALNRLLANHPCFFDGATISRLSPAGAPVLALWREAADPRDTLLCAINLDHAQRQSLKLESRALTEGLRRSLADQPVAGWHSWLAGEEGVQVGGEGHGLKFSLPPAGVCCLSPTAEIRGLTGQVYREARARAAWGLRALCHTLEAQQCGGLDWQWLAEQVNTRPADLLTAASHLAENRPDPGGVIRQEILTATLQRSAAGEIYSRVVRWEPTDARRVTPVPAGHWLLVCDRHPFRARLEADAIDGRTPAEHVQSVAAGGAHVAWLAPRTDEIAATLHLDRLAPNAEAVRGRLQFLAADGPRVSPSLPEQQRGMALLTNGRGGMARLGVDLGRIQSKYDCLLGANLHPEFPVDRHILAKRARVWVNADGFLSALDQHSLVEFEAGPPARWHFAAHAGDGRRVSLELRARMLNERNSTVLEFHRPAERADDPTCLPAGKDVRLTVRVDVEDRNFHSETQRNPGADHHFTTNTSRLDDAVGFQFRPARDRQLRVWCSAGDYHPAPEWSMNVQHPVEQSRGQPGAGDAWSPGWFEIPLAAGDTAQVFVSAELEPLRQTTRAAAVAGADAPIDSTDSEDEFGRQLLTAARAFLVKRGEGRTVVAGYPWFLDWGRDSLIAARGLLAGGFVEEVRDLALTFARFEHQGTLPNTIHGADASNRDTSDAPLWFGVVCEELTALLGDRFLHTDTGGGRTVLEVLRSIAVHYRQGTPNGIHADSASGLIWSPAHFTWMDTSYPAGTPREGYPVEIQALWIRLVRQMSRHTPGEESRSWSELAATAEAAVQQRYWLEEQGWFADVLLAHRGKAAAQATPDDALRSNGLFLVSLGLVQGVRAQRSVEAARQHLVIPGALRSLAPLPVRVPLPIHGHGGLLNDPHHPYWGRYEGDEDTRRKPAYHNGTAWTWTFPVFCEALANAYGFQPAAVEAARSYLGSMALLMRAGCLGQLPEVLDGDAPHRQRGCDAQAWGATEALRVWRQLRGHEIH
jgi:predicted glycogen debranching enzyme